MNKWKGCITAFSEYNIQQNLRGRTQMPIATHGTYRWVGDIRGTHIGNGYLKLIANEGRTNIELSANVNGVVEKYSGISRQDRPDTFDLYPMDIEPIADDASAPVGFISFQLRADSALFSEWQLFDGNAGIANWSLTQNQTATGLEAATRKPEKLIIREAELSALTIHRQELSIILTKIREVLDIQGHPIITARIDGYKQMMFADTFLALSDLPSELSKIDIQADDGSTGIKKQISLQLGYDNENKLIVQSNDERWTAGTIEYLKDCIRRYSSRGQNAIIKYGLNINGLALVAAWVAMPDVALH